MNHRMGFISHGTACINGMVDEPKNAVIVAHRKGSEFVDSRGVTIRQIVADEFGTFHAERSEAVVLPNAANKKFAADGACIQPRLGG